MSPHMVTRSHWVIIIMSIIYLHSHCSTQIYQMWQGNIWNTFYTVDYSMPIHGVVQWPSMRLPSAHLWDCPMHVCVCVCV